MTSWTDYQDDISDAISDSMDVDWSASVGAQAVVAWLNEHRPIMADTPRVTVPPQALEAIAFNLCSLHDFDVAFVRENERFATAVITEYARTLSAAPAPEGGAVSDALKAKYEKVKATTYNPGTPAERQKDGMLRGLTAAIAIAMVEEERSALAAREEAPAEAGEIGAEYDDAAHCVTLAECPPGLFLWNGTLGFKSEYGAMEPDEATNGKHWKVGNRADAYCADSGEYFWGGASNHDDRAKLLVYPIDAETVAMVASHGPSALRAQPPASPSTLSELHAAERLIDQQAAEIRRLKAREDAQPDTDCVSLLADLDAGKPVGREAAATIRSLIAERPAPDALREHERLFKALRDESWDLRCFNIPTGGDDYDIGWRVVGHWQAEPRERTIAEVFSDDPAEAVRQALAALQAEQGAK